MKIKPVLYGILMFSVLSTLVTLMCYSVFKLFPGVISWVFFGIMNTIAFIVAATYYNTIKHR